MINNYGNIDVPNGTRRFDPNLKLYSGIPYMINTDNNIKRWRVNEKICRWIPIKLKKCAIELK